MARGTSESINWEEGLIIKTFGLTKIFEGFPLLDAWLTVENNLDTTDIQLLEKRRHKLLRRMSGWNEETVIQNLHKLTHWQIRCLFPAS